MSIYLGAILMRKVLLKGRDADEMLTPNSNLCGTSIVLVSISTANMPERPTVFI